MRLLDTRFSVSTQHERSILYQLLKDPHEFFLFLDDQPVMEDQNKPFETTRKALLEELNRS